MLGDGAADLGISDSITVSVDAFCMDNTETRAAAYAECVDDGGCTAASCQAHGQSHPVICVNWSQADDYCSWAGKRLPTEDEWEYAARGNDGRNYPWGSQAPDDSLLSRYGSGDGYATSAPVGSFPAGDSLFGLKDLAGNVYEWTSSPHCSYSDRACLDADRVGRGGGWRDDVATYFRSAYRFGAGPTHSAVDLGFRCAKSL